NPVRRALIPIHTPIKFVVAVRTTALREIVVQIIDTLARTVWLRVQIKDLLSDRIEERGKNFISRESSSGVVGVSLGVGNSASGKGIVDDVERAIGIVVLREVSTSLERRGNGLKPAAFRLRLAQPFICREEEQICALPKRPTNVGAKLIAMELILGRAALVVRPGVG